MHSFCLFLGIFDCKTPSVSLSQFCRVYSRCYENVDFEFISGWLYSFLVFFQPFVMIPIAMPTRSGSVYCLFDASFYADETLCLLIKDSCSLEIRCCISSLPIRSRTQWWPEWEWSVKKSFDWRSSQEAHRESCERPWRCWGRWIFEWLGNL